MTDVFAQQDEPIDEIQVTASRRPVAAAKVSAALTIIPSEEITRSTLATDALANEIGVFLQQTTVGQGAAIIRGLKGSEILHLVDGLRLNNAIFRNAPTQYLALVAPGSIERIEVVRGSPTSLYGSDAVGGVIQVISRLPKFDSDTFEWHREL
ncbi:MAG: TonB-dependent receptor plug domain-containing protein, partial [Woeseia sp.]